MRFLSVVSVLVLFLLTACVESTPSAPAANSADGTGLPAEAPTLTPYPAPVQATLDPYPTGDAPADAYPNPGANAGGLKVQILSLKDNSPIPNIEGILLAAEGDSKNGLPSDLNKAPAAAAQSDAEGNLSFSNVPPGNYFLIIKNAGTLEVAQSSNQDSTPFMAKIGDSVVMMSTPLFINVK